MAIERTLGRSSGLLPESLYVVGVDKDHCGWHAWFGHRAGEAPVRLSDLGRGPGCEIARRTLEAALVHEHGFAPKKAREAVRRLLTALH
jgi:hypothetical protein